MEAGYVDLASFRVTYQVMAVFGLPAWRHSIKAASLLISQKRVNVQKLSHGIDGSVAPLSFAIRKVQR